MRLLQRRFYLDRFMMPVPGAYQPDRAPLPQAWRTPWLRVLDSPWLGRFIVTANFAETEILTSREQRRDARPLKDSRGGIGYQRKRPGLYGSKDKLKTKALLIWA
jgi:hypothetical protein